MIPVAADTGMAEVFSVFFVSAFANEIFQASLFSGAMDEDVVKDYLDN